MRWIGHAGHMKEDDKFQQNFSWETWMYILICYYTLSPFENINGH